MKRLLIAIVWLGSVLLGVAIVGLFASMLFFGWNMPACDESSEAVEYARSLSSARLAQLYEDMEAHSKKPGLPFNGFHRYSEEEKLPEPFSDLQVRLVRPYEANIMVEGCFDHYVYLNFYGMGVNAKMHPQKEIVLSWGEHEDSGQEVLWSAK